MMVVVYDQESTAATREKMSQQASRSDEVEKVVCVSCNGVRGIS